MVDTLLIVGGRLETCQKAVDLGIRVILLQHKEALRVGQHKLPEATILADYMDWEQVRPLVRAAHEVYGFTKVMSLAEPAMETVGRINDMLGLDGTSYEVAHLFKDKWAMRQHLAGSPLAVAAAPVEDVDSLRKFGAEHGYPFIVKPIGATGSRGVLRVDDEDGVDGAYREIEDLRTREFEMSFLFPVGEQFMMEEYLDGPELSVESFSFAGRHVVVAITEKITKGFIEMGHAEPARLRPADEEAVVACVTELLDALGLRDGNAHTEVRLTSKGPRVIETHDRVGGDRIMDLVENAYGVDLELLSVGWPFRLVPELTERPRPLRAAVTRFLYGRPGTVVEVQGVEEVRAREDVVALDVSVNPGDEVREILDNFDRAGQIIVVGPDTTSAVQACEDLAGQINIVTR